MAQQMLIMVNGAYQPAWLQKSTADAFFIPFLGWELLFDSMSKERPPEPLDFFIWTVE
ncbi:hypothetical protein HAX54_048880, partial [Datura stramonium]|nr:hypothetical protein [Datura stramonium]